METNEINLLPKKKKLSPQAQKIKNYSIKTLPWVLGLYTVILSLVLGISIFLTREIRAIERSLTSEQDRIKTFARNEGIYLLLKQKLTSLTAIFNHRFAYTQTFEFFKSLETENAKLVSVTLEESGKVHLTVDVSDSAALDTYITSLLAHAQERFQKVELASVFFTPEGNFSISLTTEELMP